jgi:hypothetical protein
MALGTKRAGILLAASVVLAGCGESEPEPRRAITRKAPAASDVAATGAATKDAGPAAVSGWGTIKGKLVWGGAEVPPIKPAAVSGDDKVYCEADGPVPDEYNTPYVVDPATKGVLNVMCFIVKPKAIHPDLPQNAAAVREVFNEEFKANNGVSIDELPQAVADKKIELRNIKAPVILDQLRCRYVPFAMVVREGQPTVVLNPETIAHNVKVSSSEGPNSGNQLMPVGSVLKFEWKAERNPLGIQCNIHGWMNGTAMVVDHPYYDVSDKDGSFEIVNVPAGDLVLFLRNPKYIDVKTGGKGTPKGNAITVKAGETLDLGEIKVQP